MPLGTDTRPLLASASLPPVTETATVVTKSPTVGQPIVSATAGTATVSIASTTTGAPGSSASVANSGTSTAAVLAFTIPRGDVGAAGTITVGSTTTGAAGTSASVTTGGTPSAATLAFTIPRGDPGSPGAAGTITVGATTTGAAGTSASVATGGTASAATLAFTIPRGDPGSPGAAGTITVGATTTGAAGTSASVTTGGTASAATLAFTIPRGDVGAAGTITVGATTTGAAGTSASVTTGGTPSAATLAFTIPRGDPGAAATIAVGTVSTGAAGSSVIITNGGSSSAATFNFTIPRGDPGTGSGTVTGVTGTSPVVSSGGAAPAISMAAATTAVSGYLTAADWATFNGKQAAFGLGSALQVLRTNSAANALEWATASGTVTSVSSGTGLTGGPITASGTLSIDSTVATLTDTQTLTNKSIDASQLTGTIAAARMPAHTGDATSSAGSVALTLATVAVAKGGTGLTAVGSALQVLRTNSAATGLEWATPSSGGSGTVTGVSVVAANGVSGAVTATTTPAITLSLNDISAATSKPTSGTARSFTSRAGDVFNVKDFGAVGNGSINDGTAIAAAITALQAYSSGTTRGTLYFPDGTYLVSSAIAITLANGYSATIKGNGRYSSIILQTGSGENGITATMTASSTAERWIEICDLGFVTADNVTAGTAVKIDYGNTVITSSDAGNGSVVTRIAINTKSYAGGGINPLPNPAPTNPYYSGGWTSGVVIRNGWKSFVHDVSGVGRANLAHSGSLPTSGAGSGSFIEITAGQNVHITNVSGMFWQYGLNFKEDPIGVIGCTAVCTTFILNVVGIGVRFGPAVFYGHTQFTGFIIDQGNAANSGYPNIAFLFDTNTRYSYVEEGVTLYAPGGYMGVSTGFITQHPTGSVGAFEIKGYSQYGIVTGVVLFAGISFLHMYTNTNSWIFNGNQTAGCTITFDAGANYHQFNCTGGSTVTNNGTGNATNVTLW